MKKKAQISQVFIYLISTLIIILVLFYGYNSIKNIGKKQQELTFVKFQNDLTDLITSTSADYGTVRVESFYVPAGFNKVCIVDPKLIEQKNIEPLPLDESLISDSVASGVKANVFVLPGGSPFYIEKASVANDFICYQVVQGKIRIRVDGMGDRALVSQP